MATRPTVVVGPGSGGLAQVQINIDVAIVTSSSTVTGPFTVSYEVQPPLIQASWSPMSNLLKSLGNGDNTITVPTNASVAVLIPPVSNTTISFKIKGASGDTGILISKAAPTVLTLDPSQSSFIINASGGIGVFVILWI